MQFPGYSHLWPAEVDLEMSRGLLSVAVQCSFNWLENLKHFSSVLIFVMTHIET